MLGSFFPPRCPHERLVDFLGWSPGDRRFACCFHGRRPEAGAQLRQLGGVRVIAPIGILPKQMRISIHAPNGWKPSTGGETKAEHLLQTLKQTFVWISVLYLSFRNKAGYEEV